MPIEKQNRIIKVIKYYKKGASIRSIMRLSESSYDDSITVVRSLVQSKKATFINYKGQEVFDVGPTIPKTHKIRWRD